MVLNHLNLNIQSGQILGLPGRNGQGKSTLLNTVSGMHSNYNGVIQILGNRDITDIEVKRQRYYIQDTPLLFEEMSPLSYFVFLHDLYRKTVNANRLKYLQDIFDFQESSEKRISTLSLGNRQKANIIAGLLLRVPSYVVVLIYGSGISFEILFTLSIIINVGTICVLICKNNRMQRVKEGRDY